LLVEGIKATPEALREVARSIRSRTMASLDGTLEDHVNRVLPDDFIFPDGTVVQFRNNSSSPMKWLWTMRA